MPANIYKDGVYYVDGKPLFDPNAAMQKVGLDPNYVSPMSDLDRLFASGQIDEEEYYRRQQQPAVTSPGIQQELVSPAPVPATATPPPLNPGQMFAQQSQQMQAQPVPAAPAPAPVPAPVQAPYVPNATDPYAGLPPDLVQQITPQQQPAFNPGLMPEEQPGYYNEGYVPPDESGFDPVTGLPYGYQPPSPAPAPAPQPTYAPPPPSIIQQVGLTPGYVSPVAPGVGDAASLESAGILPPAQKALANAGLDPGYVSPVGPGVGDAASLAGAGMQTPVNQPYSPTGDPATDPNHPANQPYYPSGDPATDPNHPANQPPIAPPQTVTPQQNYMDMFSAILDMLKNYSQQAQGSGEPYRPDTATSELSQALQDRGLQMLNREYGYSPEEEKAIWERQLNRFNATQDADLQRLEGLYEQYGLNSGAGELGGQAGSSLQDYYGKRAQALADLSGQVGEYFAAKRAGDEQAAVQMAGQIQQQIYSQVRGDFQDMLSYLETQETIDNNTFSRAMALAGFQSDEAQRDFLNQLGISDRAQQDYWLGVETAYNQGMNTAKFGADESQRAFQNAMMQAGFTSQEQQRAFLNQQGITDRAMQDYWMGVETAFGQGMQSAQFQAQQNQQQFTNQMAAAGFNAQQSQWLFNNQATIAELAAQMSQQEFENTLTAAGFTAQQAQTLFANTMAVKETNFGQQVTAQNLQDQGLGLLMDMVNRGTVSPEQIFSLVAGLTGQEAGQFTSGMNNTMNQPSALMLPLALMMNLLGNNAGTTVNVNGQGQGQGQGQGTGGTGGTGRTNPVTGLPEDEGKKDETNPVKDAVKTLATIASVAGWGKMFYEQFQLINAQQKSQHAALDETTKNVATAFTEGIMQRALPSETVVTPQLAGMTTQIMGDTAKYFSGGFNAGTFAAELFLKNKDVDVSTSEKQQALANQLKTQIENTTLNDLAPGTMEPGYWGDDTNKKAVELFGQGHLRYKYKWSSVAASYILKYIVEYNGIKG